ncbi:MAG: hypothetical protein KDK08_02690 [Rhizobiaceae bacterium]|nr:hypothetical protein [Rhizobiaceae bacterium]
MARNTAHQSQERREPRAPDFTAWHVSDKGEKSYWNKVGAAWMHKDARGYTLQLDSLPVGGRIVLRQPPEETAANDGRRA